MEKKKGQRKREKEAKEQQATTILKRYRVCSGATHNIVAEALNTRSQKKKKNGKGTTCDSSKRGRRLETTNNRPRKPPRLKRLDLARHGTTGGSGHLTHPRPHSETFRGVGHSSNITSRGGATPGNYSTKAPLQRSRRSQLYGSFVFAYKYPFFSTREQHFRNLTQYTSGNSLMRSTQRENKSKSAKKKLTARKIRFVYRRKLHHANSCRRRHPQAHCISACNALGDAHTHSHAQSSRRLNGVPLAS